MSNQSTRTLPLLAIIATMIFWGLSYVSTKSLLSYLTPLQVAGSRYIVATISLWLIGIFTGIIKPIAHKTGLKCCLQLSSELLPILSLKILDSN